LWHRLEERNVAPRDRERLGQWGPATNPSGPPDITRVLLVDGQAEPTRRNTELGTERAQNIMEQEMLRSKSR